MKKVFVMIFSTLMNLSFAQANDFSETPTTGLYMPSVLMLYCASKTNCESLYDVVNNVDKMKIILSPVKECSIISNDPRVCDSFPISGYRGSYTNMFSVRGIRLLSVVSYSSYSSMSSDGNHSNSDWGGLKVELFELGEGRKVLEVDINALYSNILYIPWLNAQSNVRLVDNYGVEFFPGIGFGGRVKADDEEIMIPLKRKAALQAPTASIDLNKYKIEVIDGEIEGVTTR